MSSSSADDDSSPERRGVSYAQPHLKRSKQDASSSSALMSLSPQSYEERVWPELVLEIVGRKVARATAQSGREVDTGPAVANMFRVCSTWGRVSHSELLWEELVRHVWDMPQEAQRRSQTWRDEYIRRHLTAFNFMNNRAEHSWIHQRYVDTPRSEEREFADFTCLHLTLSPKYLAALCSDRAVRIYSLTTKECICISRLPREIDSIVGVLIEGAKTIFASRHGDVFVGGVLQELLWHTHSARVNGDNVLIDGNMVSFMGSNRFWVGLYSLNHACNIWDAVTEKLLRNVTDISNPERMRGWHLLTQQARRVEQVQVNRNGILAVFRRGNYGVWFRQEKRLEASTNDGFLTASEDGSTIIRDVTDVEDGDSWPISFAAVANDDSDEDIEGALNTRQAFLCIDGEVQVWNARSGNIIEPLYQLNEHLGEAPDILVANDEHVAGSADDTGIQLWSFRPSSNQERSFDLRNNPEAAIN